MSLSSSLAKSRSLTFDLFMLANFGSPVKLILSLGTFTDEAFKVLW